MKPNLFRLLPLVIFIFSLFSCKKDNNDDPKTKTQLLTSSTWVYDEYFRGYNTTNTVLYYKKGKANNLMNMDINRVTFRADGTYTEITETGATVNGTWTFLNGETQLQVVNTGGTFTSNIVLLDDKNFTWFDPITSNGTLGRMIHQ